MSNAAPVLKTTGLSTRYGKRLALAGLDLEVPPGRVFGFLGPNGAGKTTAISLILGLISPTAGRVELFGKDTGPHLAESLLRVGAVLEGVSFYPHLSARDNLRVCAAISGGDSAGRIESTLGLVGLAGRAKDKVRGYSMGMRQRLALGAALLHDPELLVLDEPTNGLDPAGMREFRDTIRDLGRSGKTIFVSSHLLGEVEQMCDEVAIVKEGRVIASGTVAELVRQGDALELRVTDVAKATEALATLPWPVVATDGDRLTVEAPRDSAAEISKALAERQVYLYELRPRETSLEDIFLELTSPETTK
jgi:ABC-2 type transport system ATP-binding protein